MTIRKMLLGTIAASLLAGSAYAADMSRYEHPGKTVHSMADIGGNPTSAPPPTMEPAILVLAVAYIRYCGPLQPRVLAAANAAMEKLTPDQRWNIERSSYDNFELRQIGTYADPPSVRAGVNRMQQQACERSKAQLGQ
jgi:hypothetical protein